MIINGNAPSIPLADKSVHCIVTSPPYFHMRDYGVIGQLGAERTPEEFISNIVAVFAEVYRVSRADSTLWLNISDSYAGSAADRASKLYGVSKTKLLKEWGYHTKEELDIPHRLANAIRSIGWQKRCTVIWSKPNPMPESVTDRPTKAHEYLFLLTKQERYYYDAEAVREDKAESTINDERDNSNGHRRDRDYPGSASNGGTNLGGSSGGRNRRTVWTIPTAPYKGAHFATYPPALVEPCIKAGTSERGCCPKCGKGWRRVVEKSGEFQRRWSPNNADGSPYQKQSSMQNIYTEVGWQPSCPGGQDNGGPLEPIPAIVFDPFVGSGTTVKVAYDLGRRGVGLDLSLEYLDGQARNRIHNGHIGRLL